MDKGMLTRGLTQYAIYPDRGRRYIMIVLPARRPTPVPMGSRKKAKELWADSLYSKRPCHFLKHSGAFIKMTGRSLLEIFADQTGSNINS